jgi:two-component system, chemotaxis family, protein-glutamate methylesterase/glutaminase
MSSSERRRAPRRVLVVDDSELMRRLLTQQITALDGFTVVGEAATGHEAIRLVHELDPDLLTLDLVMPELGGLDVIRYIMAESPRPVVVVSAHTRAMAAPVMNAIEYGAVEFVAKPATQGSDDVRWFQLLLAAALRAAAAARLLNLHGRLLRPRTRREPEPLDRRARMGVAIAASTGGPGALATIVPQLPADLDAAVFIVQHMPPHFTAALARRLHGMSALEVTEAEHDMIAMAGVAYVARGGQHLEVVRETTGIRIRLTDSPAVWGVRPAADVTLPSVARTFGPSSIGVVLTGMGRDGASGLRSVRDAGGWAIAQDEESSVIASMPRAAAIYAHAVLPLDDIAANIVERVTSPTARRRRQE